MTELHVAARFENTGPPPFASGEDWAAYFREYRRKQDAKRSRNGLKLVVVDGMETVVEDEGDDVAAMEITEISRQVPAASLPGAAKTFALAARKRGFEVECRRWATTVSPVKFKWNSKQDAKAPHEAGDERYPGYTARHFGVGAVAGRDGKALLMARAFWTEKTYEGKKPSLSFLYAQTLDPGGWDQLSHADFQQWQVDLKIKEPPKKKAEPEEGVWIA